MNNPRYPLFPSFNMFQMGGFAWTAKTTLGHLWRFENRTSWWTLSSLILLCLNDTICFKDKRQKCIIMVESRGMYYMYEILERCSGKFIKLNQINQRKMLEDSGD